MLVVVPCCHSAVYSHYKLLYLSKLLCTTPCVPSFSIVVVYSAITTAIAHSHAFTYIQRSMQTNQHTTHIRWRLYKTECLGAGPAKPTQFSSNEQQTTTRHKPSPVCFAYTFPGPHTIFLTIPRCPFAL